MKTIFNQPIRTLFLGLITGAAALMLVSSCKKDDGYQFEGAVTAKVQLINASTDAGPVKLYLDNVLRTQDAVAFGSASGYADAYTGQQDVSVQTTSGTAVATTSSEVDPANKYTFVLSGAAGVETIITVKDDLTTPASGMARIRFIQASPDASSLSLVANGAAVFSAVNYKAASSAADIAAGNYTFKLVNAGGGTLYTSGSIALAAGKTYTIYSKGTLEGNGTAALGIGVASVN